MADLIDAKGEFFTKPSAEAAFYEINWATDLGTDTISGTAATWVVPSGLTDSNRSQTATTTRLKLAGGIAGVEYAVTCTVATTGGQTLGPRTLWIRITPFPTLATNALIDLDYLKTAMRIYEQQPQSSIDNVLLAQKINEASDLIETLCKRTFKTADYVERISWRPSVKLKQFPIQYVRAIHRAVRDGLILKNTSTKDYATAWVSGNRKLYLGVQGGSSHGLLTIDLTLAANDTLGELISVIGALGSGWTCTLADGRTGNERSEDLVELSAQIVETTGLIVKLLDVPESCGFKLNESAGMIEDLTTPYAILDYRYQDAWVKYRAGFDTIPDDLKMVAANVAKYLFEESNRDSGLRSETIGEYSYTRETGQDLEGKRPLLPTHLLSAIAAFESYSL